MRVIAGIHKGRRLRSEPGLRVRPTSDRLRETLFNILAPRIGDTTFLDLCAGSGAVGIEALSRGAARATFVEHSRRALVALVENLARCGIGEEAEVVQRDAVSAVKQFIQVGRRFDLIFCDPPYASPLYDPLFELLGTQPLLDEDGWFIVEHHAKHAVVETIGDLRRFRAVQQGESTLSFFSRW
ncbi:16S rRNA (guanine(966)-N(2))-methyltransferase RsmD [Chloracidobacterium aggregatum]|uniref:16S rRNA (Guanine(966)-N(2))-methyltransferase RsmD n=1 Tax=Chloracidobacterium sp. N TaxID=2821540 RepID=A0ABX8B3V1_9BACT|nr:16S rRNA (guanine(966)-N(2))-methyltransferase RsmD [Chloracidobacterium aggregatum]QUV83836.1 16S rRNA (guanine(966)-N(2))-methyltransferase RsmD [Chloracidobacterium sp. 2]QUV87684.1 16S rRNA (guanine(966)-N(2))-methyltransferase RsmD [Chloracidobacterium sp. S]QUV90583.1 16S rRNA (guanine(966)-N(2))-methyltransferase RsmD [Chloracidobacterium sp. A]QUV93796.1 16S rRNA (guanine(966)-N(2))-methyltransferase RsmD [Chloracidobacterium sp. N]QUV96985.1 16S rRNA (guanine(966)-N(2))-methyltrans